jgi:polysaccharide biosynthesis transport protein
MGRPDMTIEPESPQNAVPTKLGLEEALAVWYRRKWLAVLVFGAVLAVMVPVPLNLPNIYSSTATVLVEHQQIPPGAVGYSADSELETRLRTISEQILSRSRLYDLINQFDLYPELRQRETPEEVARAMRRDIRIQFTGVQQPTGLEATITFSLSYRGRDPETVARVTNALAALYVEENTRMQTRQTTGTAEFLQAQLADARQQMEAQEQKLSAFKERHIGELPEQQGANLAALARLNDQIRTIKARRDELTQAAGVASAGADTIPARLATLRRQLADLRTRDTDEHPDVVRVKQQIAALERQLAVTSGTSAGPDPSTSPATAPDPADSELAALRAEEHSLQSRIATYEQRVENAPLIEQELQQYTQDYATASNLYQSLLQRYEGAQLAERMDQRLQGEQFRILDPAVASQRPAGPHRIRFLFVALLLSIGAGVGAAVLAESADTSFRSVDDLRAFTTAPVLGSIPPILTGADVRRRRRRFYGATLGAALGILLLAAGSSYLAHTTAGALVRLFMPASLS